MRFSSSNDQCYEFTHQERLDADEIDIPAPADDEDLLAVNDALVRFAELDAQKAELVKLRYFIGMSFAEAAAVLNISEPTAKRWWAYARAWLHTAVKAS